MSNITFGANNLTKGTKKETKKEIKKSAKEVKETSNIELDFLETIKKEQEKILNASLEFYKEHPSNGISTSINLMEMVIQKINNSIEGVKQFGKQS